MKKTFKKLTALLLLGLALNTSTTTVTTTFTTKSIIIENPNDEIQPNADDPEFINNGTNRC